MQTCRQSGAAFQGAGKMGVQEVEHLHHNTVLVRCCAGPEAQPAALMDASAATEADSLPASAPTDAAAAAASASSTSAGAESLLVAEPECMIIRTTTQDFRLDAALALQFAQSLGAGGPAATTSNDRFAQYCLQKRVDVVRRDAERDAAGHCARAGAAVVPRARDAPTVRYAGRARA